VESEIRAVVQDLQNDVDICANRGIDFCVCAFAAIASSHPQGMSLRIVFKLRRNFFENRNSKYENGAIFNSVSGL
jgi:hypothetical protein